VTQLQPVFARRPLRILLVEDSPLLRSRLIHMLSEHNEMEVAGCAAAEAEAVERIGDVLFDALVVDVELRPGSGIGVIREVRAANIEASGQDRKPIVVLTNYDLPAVRERCMHAGADFFLDKMREIDQLVPLLLTLARQFQERALPRS
jgi:DNA-binding NarL/FixJ family response regulator